MLLIIFDQMIQQSSAKKGNTGPKQEEQGDQARAVLYLSIMVNSGVFSELEDEEQRSTLPMFKEKKIKSIHRCREYIQISVTQNKSTRKKKQVVQESAPLEDPEVQNELIKLSQGFKTLLPAYHDKMLPNLHLHEGIFKNWLKEKEDRPLVGWFMPMNQLKPRLTKAVFTKSLLNILGYDIQEAPSELTSYWDLTFSFLDEVCMKKTFMTFLTAFRKFISAEIVGDIEKEDVVKESETTMISMVKGKHKRIKLELLLVSPEPFAVFMEVIKVLEDKEVKEQEEISEQEEERLDREKGNNYKQMSKHPEPEIFDEINKHYMEESSRDDY